MMIWMNDYSVDVKFWIFCGLCLAIIFGILGIVAIIEAIDEMRAERKRRKYGKRYTVEIRPERRY